MKRKLITLTIASGLALGLLATVKAGDQGGPGCAGHEHMGNPLQHLTKALNLTADQTAKVQPIIDQAKPQIVAIHQEAMEKMKTVMESAGAQIRPLLTPEQQQKFDAMKKAHEDMHNAMQEMHDVEKK